MSLAFATAETLPRQHAPSPEPSLAAMLAPAATRSPDGAGRDWPLALLAATQWLLFLVPLLVLGQAIGWPASLRLPAAEVLPLIREQASAVQIGYGAYLLVALAQIPLALILARHLRRLGAGGWGLEALTLIGAIAGGFKMLGILRWLTAMPLLAEAHAVADTAGQSQIHLLYTALNSYAGGIGELLGVQLLSGLWLAGIGWILLRQRQPFMGAGALLIGAMLLLTALRIAVPALGAVQMVALPLAMVWFLALSLQGLRRVAG